MKPLKNLPAVVGADAHVSSSSFHDRTSSIGCSVNGLSIPLSSAKNPPLVFRLRRRLEPEVLFQMAGQPLDTLPRRALAFDLYFKAGRQAHFPILSKRFVGRFVQAHFHFPAVGILQDHHLPFVDYLDFRPDTAALWGDISDQAIWEDIYLPAFKKCLLLWGGNDGLLLDSLIEPRMPGQSLRNGKPLLEGHSHDILPFTQPE